MNRFRWIALCACTLFFLYLTRAGLPPRLPLIPARGLAVTLRAAAIVNAPRHVCRRLENSALVDGLFTYDPAQAEADRSKEARNAGLPALRPPVTVPMEQRQRLDAALAWLRPEAAAVVLVDTDTRRETWLGVQGGRTGLAGRLAAWFVPNIKVGDSLWMRIANQPLDPSPTPSAPTPANAPVDWLRPNRADIALLLPAGLPPPRHPAALTTPTNDPLGAACRAAGLPGDLRRFEGLLWIEPDRLRWEGRVDGNPHAQPVVPAGPPNFPATPHLPSPGAPGVFLTFRCNLDWPRLYHNLVDGLNEAQRADFLRSMRYYRLAQKGYAQPEADLINPLGCGVALVGRRGPEYAGNRLMPSLQAEIPLQPPQPGLLTPLIDSPNARFRRMMPDFAEARFDKIRRVGESSYSVHPSYVAVTIGDRSDRYVLVRPSIAGSALLPAWQVDEARIKIGTRPDVLEEPDLLVITPVGAAPVPTPPPVPPGPANQPAPTLALYFDPAGITEQLDKFRILVMVEAGSDRPTPDDGISAEKIEIENQLIAKRTAANMQLAAQIGWVLKQLGPFTLEVTPVPPSEATASESPTISAVFRGTLELKARP